MMKKCFFVTDLILVATMLILAVHYWWAVTFPIIHLIVCIYPLLLRMTIGLRRQWGFSYLSTLLLFLVISLPMLGDMAWLDYASEKLIKAPIMLWQGLGQGDVDYQLASKTGKEYGYLLKNVIVFWIWWLPIIMLLGKTLFKVIKERIFHKPNQGLNLRKILGGDSLSIRELKPDWSCQTLWHNKEGRMILFVTLVFLLASIMGYDLNYLPSFMGVMILPIASYLLWCKYLAKIKGKPMEMIMMLAGSLFLWMAQYETHEARVLFLLAGTLCHLCGWGYLCHRTHQMRYVVSMVLLGSSLTFLSMGYNPLSCIQAKRLYRMNCSAYSSGVMYVKSSQGMGIRDRYGMILPAIYEDIIPLDTDNKPYVKVIKNGQEAFYDYYLHEWIAPKLTICPQWQEKAEALLKITLEESKSQQVQAIVMDARTGFLRVMATIGSLPIEETYKNPWEITYDSELIQPFTMLAAINTGKVSLKDSTDTEKYGVTTFGEGLKHHSHIAIYHAAKKAFGDDKEKLLDMLKGYGYDQPLMLKDKNLNNMVDIKGKGQILPKGISLFDLSNGHGLEITPLQIVRMYSLLALEGSTVNPILYRTQSPIFPNMVEYCEGIPLINSILTYQNWSIPMQKMSPPLTKLIGYASNTPLKQGSNEKGNEEKVVSFCGIFAKGKEIYVIFAMLRGHSQDTKISNLAGIVQPLADYICQEDQQRTNVKQ